MCMSYCCCCCFFFFFLSNEMNTILLREKRERERERERRGQSGGPVREKERKI